MALRYGGDVTIQSIEFDAVRLSLRASPIYVREFFRIEPGDNAARTCSNDLGSASITSNSFSWIVRCGRLWAVSLASDAFGSLVTINRETVIRSVFTTDASLVKGSSTRRKLSLRSCSICLGANQYAIKRRVSSSSSIQGSVITSGLSRAHFDTSSAQALFSFSSLTLVPLTFGNYTSQWVKIIADCFETQFCRRSQTIPDPVIGSSTRKSRG